MHDVLLSVLEQLIVIICESLTCTVVPLRLSPVPQCLGTVVSTSIMNVLVVAAAAAAAVVGLSKVVMFYVH